MESAKQSFINAGYKSAEVELAVQKMPQATSQISKQVTTPVENSTIKTSAQIQGDIPLVSQEKKKLSKKFKIILVIISVIIFIVATVFGLFWNKIF